jgi:hypothetical protein
MSRIYLVSYQFRNDPEDYPAFFEVLQSFDGWWHYIDGTWLVATDLDAKSIRDRLLPHLDNDVNLLVAEVGNDMAGWLPKDAWDWIREKRKQVPSLAVQG